MVQQAQNIDEASFARYLTALQEQAQGPLESGLQAAKEARNWAKAALMAGNAEEAKAFIKRAEYLEFCQKNNIPVE